MKVSEGFWMVSMVLMGSGLGQATLAMITGGVLGPAFITFGIGAFIAVMVIRCNNV